jgi:hypothetical protein
MSESIVNTDKASHIELNLSPDRVMDARSEHSGNSQKSNYLHRHITVVSKIIREISIVILGIVFPVILLFQAYQGMGEINATFQPGNDMFAILKNMPKSVQELHSVNDYEMLSMVFLETSNARVVMNKQRMKIAVIHIGFAVISIGLMMVMLGFDAGGIEATGSIKEDVAPVNIKVASTGVLVFLLGAGMSAAGGLMPNLYQTLGIPNYVYFGKVTQALDRKAAFEKLKNECLQQNQKEQDLNECLNQAQSKIYPQ